MKAVMKSVSTEIFEKIVDRKSSILDSKTNPNCETPFKVYVYCNKAKTQWRYSEYEGAYQNSDGEIICAQQRVACEFVCNDTNGGWHISDLKIYDKPKMLSNFVCKTRIENCVNYCKNGICAGIDHEELCCNIKQCTFKRFVPKSWCYVEEL